MQLVVLIFILGIFQEVLALMCDLWQPLAIFFLMVSCL